WAAFTPLDAAAHAHGQLVISGERRTIQHPLGGVVDTIRVQEGQHVSAGEVLLQLAGPDTRSQYSSITAQLVNLLAQRSRLQSEISGAGSIDWAPELANGDFPAELVQRAKTVQTDEFRARRSLLLTQQRILEQQSNQIRESATGYRSQDSAARDEERLLDQEI